MTLRTLRGERLVFIVSGRDRPDAVYWRRADGTGDAEHLIHTRAGEGWMAGGKQLRFLTLKETAGNRDYGIAVLDMSSRKVTHAFRDHRHKPLLSSVGRAILGPTPSASNTTSR